MNLTKLFNFKYLKENLKKSKGQLIFSLVIVPVFTFLVLLLTLNEPNADMLDIEYIYPINIIGMYAVPIILSVSLFGYIYKKKSVDFINSMPMSKRTVFCTNTLGGILLIIGMQLLNMLAIFVVCGIHKNVIVFPEMIFDSFIVMTISYIFVFIASNVAMSISGNVLTQIAVTFLILFFIPFLVDSVNASFSENIYYNMLENGSVIGGLKIKSQVEETMPYRIFSLIINNSFDRIFDLRVIFKMIFVSIIYLFIGANLFKNRKFENTVESFANKYMHFFVKSLTMFPMIMILVYLDYLEQDIELILFIFAILIAYYYIYDIITAKKIRFKDSVITLVVTLVVLNVVCIGIKKVNESDRFNLNKEDIKEISIDLGRENGKSCYNKEILNYYMDDKELIDYIYMKNINNENQMYYPYFFVKIPARIKLKNGKILETTLSISGDTLNGATLRINELIDILEKDEKYVNLYKNQYKEDGKFAVCRFFGISDEDNEFLNKKINEYIDNHTIKEIFHSKANNLEKYTYTNHRPIKVDYNCKMDEEMFKKIIEISNAKSIEIVKNGEFEYNFKNYNIELKKYDDTRIYNYYEDVDIKSIENIILEDKDTNISSNDTYFIVRSYNSGICYFTKDERIQELFMREHSKDNVYVKEKYYNEPIEDVEVQAVENSF